MMPYDVPVTQPGSAVHQNTSSVMEVERELARDVMRDDGAVHVDGAFGRARRAAREVEQGAICSSSVGAIVNRSLARSSRRRRFCVPGHRGGVAGGAIEQHVAQIRQRVANGGDLPLVERGRGDEHARRRRS